MAADTSKTLRNKVIYCIFVRNYSREGTFRAVEKDLDRIRKLGTDIIWLMPVQPVGREHRKGTLGSPYAIADYRAVNPEFGTMEDFRSLVQAIHAHGMQCILDVVYNHTSPDSWLAQHHPEWFFHKEDGQPGGRIGDWWDVVDLDYTQKDLWYYQTETLCQWAKLVDGFRCDVAPLVPLDFWKQARLAVETVHPGALWLAESVEPEFIRAVRSHSIACSTDSEIYQAFDLCYDYDIYGYWRGYLTGQNTLAAYAAAINRQEVIYPDNYCKLRFLENHDQLRAHFQIPAETALRNWTAFSYFQKGTTLVYAGQESGARHTPTLFDKDPIDWKEGGLDLTPLMQRLYQIRQDPVFTDSSYEVHALPGDLLLAVHTQNSAGGRLEEAENRQPEKAVGLFSCQGKAAGVRVDRVLPDGRYQDQISGRMVEVDRGQLWTDGEPMILFSGQR